MNENFRPDITCTEEKAKASKSQGAFKNYLIPALGVILGVASLVLFLVAENVFFLILGVVLLVSVFRIHPAVRKIYYTVNAEEIKKAYGHDLFYGGLDKANTVLVEIAKNAFGKANKENINHCFQIYLEAFTRSHGGLSPEYSKPDYILERLCEKYANLPKRAVTLCTLTCLKYIYRNEPEMVKRLEVDVAMNGALQNVHLGQAQNNKHLFDLYLEDEEYGLVLNKPVFVNGFNGAREYLAQLVDIDGVEPEIERVGSMGADEICGAVDLYSLSFGADKKMQIYVCNYGLQNSTVAPRGLRLRDKESVHKWRCNGCGKMRVQTPCEHCGKE